MGVGGVLLGVVTSAILAGVFIGEDVMVMEGSVGCEEVGGEVDGALAFSGELLSGLVMLVRFRSACTDAVTLRLSDDEVALAVVVVVVGAAASDF